MTYISLASSEERDESQFGRVVEYALRHDAQHFEFHVGDRIGYLIGYRLSNMFSSNLNCNLRTLELRCITIDSGFRSFGFPRMTSLKLDWCPLQEEDLDPFSNFPCLENLSLTNCPKRLPLHMDEVNFKVSGLQLLSLELASMLFCKVEIVAPKLKFLHLSERVEECSAFSELCLPSLVHADIHVYPWSKFNGEEWLERHLFSLFKGLQNASCLTLHSATIQVLVGFDKFLEEKPSPLTRLEHLNVNSSSIPYEVVDYFLKGSSSTEPNVQFPKM